jgi:hypothetical protein
MMADARARCSGGWSAACSTGQPRQLRLTPRVARGSPGRGLVSEPSPMRSAGRLRAPGDDVLGWDVTTIGRRVPDRVSLDLRSSG